MNLRNKIDRTDIDTTILRLSKSDPLTMDKIDLIMEVLKLAPYFDSEPPKGLDPTFYHTLSYEGDMRQYKRLKEIVTICIQ